MAYRKNFFRPSQSARKTQGQNQDAADLLKHIHSSDRAVHFEVLKPNPPTCCICFKSASAQTKKLVQCCYCAYWYHQNCQTKEIDEKYVGGDDDLYNHPYACEDCQKQRAKARKQEDEFRGGVKLPNAVDADGNTEMTE
ncbi:hypothetical protein NA57DRAFT_60384 [Rhizodiscina lignyota]|uniref:PHD-type domain-containing protein n=1 Tax=Rhizodiscina lignyota TaxID=1504668 RepID=A0A9P4I970_9PEZI|nr:hypothetical protein NA57DRAFT_60384 [Rhizodiscina lignyota]